MTFRVGDEVVCVDAMTHIGGRTLLERGKVYTVLGGWVTPCCGVLVVDVGSLGAGGHTCGCGAESFIDPREPRGHYPWRFVKLPKLQVDRAIEAVVE